jgi:hypothetical protein
VPAAPQSGLGAASSSPLPAAVLDVLVTAGPSVFRAHSPSHNVLTVGIDDNNNRSGPYNLWGKLPTQRMHRNCTLAQNMN